MLQSTLYLQFNSKNEVHEGSEAKSECFPVVTGDSRIILGKFAFRELQNGTLNIR